MRSFFVTVVAVVAMPGIASAGDIRQDANRLFRPRPANHILPSREAGSAATGSPAKPGAAAEAQTSHSLKQ
jgi:hypothetical protein